jgi:hypothetical protein
MLRMPLFFFKEHNSNATLIMKTAPYVRLGEIRTHYIVHILHTKMRRCWPQRHAASAM